MSRVLVTGASGFIGSHACEALAQRGHEVHGVSSADADLLAPDGARRVIEATRPSDLLHFAWYAVPGRYWEAPENEQWVDATARLVREFAAAGGRRAVLAGTCAEYDWGAEVLSEDETPIRPASLYGRSKAAAHEVAARIAAQAGVSLAWGRIFFLYGPREHPDRLVSSVARALLAGTEARTTEGTQVRDFMHVADVAAAFCALLEGDVTGAVNIGSGVPVTVRAVIEAVGEAAGRPELLRIGALAPRAGEPPVLVADARRLRDEVGFRPRYELESGIRQTVEWWRAQG